MPNVRLELEWKKSDGSSYKKGSFQHVSYVVMKKKLYPLGLDGQILLCKLCRSHRHLETECPDSWENMMKRKDRKGNMKSVYQSNKGKILGKIDMNDEAQLDVSDLCNVSAAVSVEDLASEVTESKKKKMEMSRDM